LQRDWPNWSIWRTETLWNATRRGPLPETPRGFFSRHGQLALTLLEDGPRELLAALENQAAIEAEAEAILALGHTGDHAVTAACPIRCLNLQQATEDALIVHWRAEGNYAPTVRDLLQLLAAPEPDDDPNGPYAPLGTNLQIPQVAGIIRQRVGVP